MARIGGSVEGLLIVICLINQVSIEGQRNTKIESTYPLLSINIPSYCKQYNKSKVLIGYLEFFGV